MATTKQEITIEMQMRVVLDESVPDGESAAEELVRVAKEEAADHVAEAENRAADLDSTPTYLVRFRLTYCVT